MPETFRLVLGGAPAEVEAVTVFEGQPLLIAVALPGEVVECVSEADYGVVLTAKEARQLATCLERASLRCEPDPLEE